MADPASDPRLLEWLALARGVLEAPVSELLVRFEDAQLRRAELVRSLESEPPHPAPSAELAAELDEYERALGALAEKLLVEVRARIEELRRVRGGTQGYRQARVDVPSYVSRKA